MIIEIFIIFKNLILLALIIYKFSINYIYYYLLYNKIFIKI